VALIDWNDDMSVNDDVLDRQHQELIAMINDLGEAMEQGKGKEILSEIFTRLMNYSLRHFRSEEKYIERLRYPEANYHKQVHANFITKVTEFKKKLDDENEVFSVNVLCFMRDWLYNHIMMTDRQYVRFFKNRVEGDVS